MSVYMYTDNGMILCVVKDKPWRFTETHLRNIEQRELTVPQIFHVPH